MVEDYIFWTLALSEEARKSVIEMISSARAVGLYKDFHVWTRIPIDDAECHDPGEVDPRGGLYRMQLLPALTTFAKATHLVWVEPTTRFEAHSGTVLGALRGSPIHVPLTFELTNALQSESEWQGCPHAIVVDLMRASGLDNRVVYAAVSNFFIVHRDVIGTANGLGKAFWQRCNSAGWPLTVEPVLAFVMQMLCADARRHVAAEA